MIFGEELGVGGFMAVLGSATGEFGEEEDFVGVKGIGRMTVEVAVENGGEFGNADIEAGFFASFAGSGNGGRFPDIGPTAWKGPATVLELADEKDASITEGSDADIDFGSGVAGLLGEEIADGSGSGKSGARGHHLRRNVPDFLVAVNVKFFLAIGETRLRDGLEAPGPGEPLGNGHSGILAARGSANKRRGFRVCSRTRLVVPKSTSKQGGMA